MPGKPQPLVNNQRIVGPDGLPTEYFIRWAQDRQIDISSGIDADQAQQLIDDWAAARQIIAGNVLSGGGSLASDVTLDHEPSLVTPGSYTNANITVDAFGHVTAAADGSGGGGGALIKLAQAVTVAAQTTVTFTAIPATYQDLVLTISARGTAAVTSLPVFIRYNTDAGANYDQENENRFGFTQAYAQTSGILASITGTTTTRAADFTGVSVEFFSYRSVLFNKVSYAAAMLRDNANIYQDRTNVIWASLAAINRIDMFLTSGAFQTGSVFTLYGRG